MNVTREQVNHRQFGVGTVTGQNTTTVTVKFCKKFGSRKFLYPSAFESFLELCDPVIKGQMDDKLRLEHKQVQQERQLSAEREKKRHEDAQQAQLVKKRAAKKLPASKKTPKKLKKQSLDLEPLEEENDA